MTENRKPASVGTNTWQVRGPVWCYPRTTL